MDLSNNFQIGEVKQDDTVVMNLKITENGNPVKLNGVTVQLAVERSDKKSFAIQNKEIYVQDNTIVINVDTNCLSVSGLNRLELILSSSDGTIRSSDFFILIRPKVPNSNTGGSI